MECMYTCFGDQRAQRLITKMSNLHFVQDKVAIYGLAQPMRPVCGIRGTRSIDSNHPL